MIYFEYDGQFVFVGETERKSKYETYPVKSTAIEPPALQGNEYAVFNGEGWNVVTDKPVNPALVPQVVTMRQARAALITEVLIDDVQIAVDDATGVQGQLIRNEWEHSQTVERNRPFVALIGTALGLDDTQLDDLFILASTL